VGAILSGIAATCGCLLGAKLLNHSPGWLLLIIIPGEAIAAFFCIHFIGYLSADMLGHSAQETIPFGTYLAEVITHSTVTLRTYYTASTPTEVGGFGYVFTALQIIGFALGGILVYALSTFIPPRVNRDAN
jgi:hypothetical protein